MTLLIGDLPSTKPAAPTPPPAVNPKAGHVVGIPGRFAIERSTGDSFTDVLDNLSARLADPGVTRLKHPILSPEEWINSPYHCGPLIHELWPRKKRDFIEAAQGDVTECHFTGGIGLGKTQKMKVLLVYDLYRLSCFESPQQALGMNSSESIVMVLVSLNLVKARAKLFDPTKALIDSIPYFRDNCRYDSRKTAALHFDNGVVVKPGITGEGAVHSEDVIFLGVSEANFLPVVSGSAKKRGVDELDVAADLVMATIRRMKTRFMRGDRQLPLCRLVLDSSRDLPDSYMELRMALARAGDLGHKTVIQSNAIWEEKAGVRDASGKLIFSGETFPLELGTNHRASRILTEEEVPHAVGRVLRVAAELLPDFKRDLEGSIRDLAGEASLHLRRLFPQSGVLDECIRSEELYPEAVRQHPFTAFRTTLADGVELIEGRLINPETGKPWLNPDAPRCVHIDVGLSNDSMGFAMGHVADLVPVDRSALIGAGTTCRRCDGEKTLICDRCNGAGKKKQLGEMVSCYRCKGKGRSECPACGGEGIYAAKMVLPRVELDIILEIVPPDGGQIQFSAVEALISHLEKLGFTILVTSADGTYCTQFIQRQQSEFNRMFAEKLSMDTSKDPYLMMKEAILDVAEDGQRRLSWYSHPEFLRQAEKLEDRPKKIDHPSKGKKDLPDAVAGVYRNCATYPVLQYKLEKARVGVTRF